LRYTEQTFGGFKSGFLIFVVAFCGGPFNRRVVVSAYPFFNGCIQRVGFGRHQSGGQQQRVAIARAIAGQPRILLADEPTGNLDSLMARQVMELLEQINQQGCTILMVTHDPDQARRAGRNIQIIDGQLHDSTLYDPLTAQTA